MATVARAQRTTRARIAALTFLVICATSSSHGRTGFEPGEGVEACSLINLIATPEAYDGKLIETWGVARMAFEGTAVYVSLESAQRRTRVNGVYLALADSDITESERNALDLKWIHVVGVYHKAKPRGVDWRGHIEGIVHLAADE